MATFNTKKIIKTDLTELSGVVEDTRRHFSEKGYTVKTENGIFGSFISLTKGGIFKTVLGLKTSLNVDVKCVSEGVSVNARVGIFGQQLIPTLIVLFVTWPVILTQITGLVRQAKLDDEVIGVIEQSIQKHQAAEKEHCISCGAAIAKGSAFCPHCGTKQ